MQNQLSHTKSLLKHVFWFKHHLNLHPQKDHIGSAIEWTDISERRYDFLRELVNTVSSWVYSNTKSKKIVDERLKIVEGDLANACNFLTTQAAAKFRPSHPQGQFGELLLFNFIQFFFEAVPLLRKQRITTSVGHERFGADAIHYKRNDTDNIIILGESKCYKSNYQFANAFNTSLESIINTLNNFSEELDLYTYDDFIEPALELIAKKYKIGELENVQYELVCLIAYNETQTLLGENETDIKNSIEKIIKDRCQTLDKECYDKINSRILNRLNYIIFPIWELDKLLDEFKKKVGSE
ncbi:MAG: DUF1837 domain-containing protein [Candidatus Lokiarchaeota archaeon]|nr:DUF1837 domain-containing protein [Candidatus Lokiarchaeota archaeon]